MDACCEVIEWRKVEVRWMFSGVEKGLDRW